MNGCGGPPRLRVLVVSDLAAVRAIFRDCLGSEEFDVFFEDGRKDMFDFAQWAEPHIVFLALEELYDSISLYRRLRSDPALTASAIALLSLPAVPSSLFVLCDAEHDSVLFAKPVVQEIEAFAARHAQRLRALSAQGGPFPSAVGR